MSFKLGFRQRGGVIKIEEKGEKIEKNVRFGGFCCGFGKEKIEEWKD